MNDGHVVDRADPAEHLQHRLVGAAVQRAVERADAAGDRGVRVDLGGADRPDRVGGGVLLVVGVQDEQDLQRPHQAIVGGVLGLAHLEQHGQEVRGVAELVVRVDVRLALGVPERERAERRHLRDQPPDLQRPGLLVEDVARLGIEGGQRPDRREQHPHRVRVVPEALHEGLQVLVHERVIGHVVRPGLVLRLVRQLAVHQQVGHLEVVRLLGELLDRVAAVLQDALVTVDEGDRRAAGGGVDEAGVVGGQATVAVGCTDLFEIGGTDGAIGDGKVEVLAGPVVPDGERLFGHDALFGSWRHRLVSEGYRQPAGRGSDCNLHR